ncbi:hypothetical protein HDU79_004745 [Rhizoclosmatium sp. JEL0117]|nr:hypothetical protein HDU79_004745 [Rhizoclosmatium sp. JEL0117]
MPSESNATFNFLSSINLSHLLSRSASTDFISSFRSFGNLSDWTTKKEKRDTVNLTYGGGPVISNVEVTPIFYDASTRFQPEMLNFYSAITDSVYMNALQEYSTQTQLIGRGKLVGSYVETGTIKGNLNDAKDVRPYVRSLVEQGILNPNSNSYYPIHFTKGINITTSGGRSCVNFAGYHSAVYTADISGVDWTAYGVIPLCDDNLNIMLHPVSHELAEAITDPFPESGWKSRSKSVGEIADLCNWVGGQVVDSTGKKWEVEPVWSNKQQKCITGVPTAAVQTLPVPATPNVVKLTSRGGAVFKAVEITPIFYGSNVAFQDDIVAFYNFLVSSSYFDLLAEYGIDAEKDATKLMRSLITSKTITPNRNSYYIIHTAPNISPTYQGLTICPNYCEISGWASVADLTKASGGYVQYSVIPDFSTTSCAGAW